MLITAFAYSAQAGSGLSHWSTKVSKPQTHTDAASVHNASQALAERNGDGLGNVVAAVKDQVKEHIALMKNAGCAEPQPSQIQLPQHAPA